MNDSPADGIGETEGQESARLDTNAAECAPDSLEDMAEHQEAAPAGIPVVGIGASAGGLDAFKQLLAQLPPDTGFAVVLIQHLDPSHHSILSGILGRTTKVPVIEAADGMAVEPDHVYVIPPNSELTIANQRLALSPRGQAPGPHLPIDRFLGSLAKECGSRAVGVILSGAGTDGAAGLQAIKEAGGVTFAQDPATAEFPSMPRAAEASTCVDFILPPERIAAELVRIVRHPYLADPLRGGEAPAQADNQFGAVFAVLRKATGVDFSLYRQQTMHRRILRRLALLNIRGVAEYAQRLEKDPAERGALQRDLLISVTSFFRDPETFEALKQFAFPRMVQDRPADAPIRIWVPGCATGEEAYSIAILLQEYLKETGSAFPVQIFASDINEAAIEKARGGRYLANIVADVGPERLNRCFTKDETGYQIDKTVREMCVFSRHNLIDDPPFAKLDLISCRNVLIYLGGIQKDIISRFHYALRPGGFLFLGRCETAAFGDLFSMADGPHRIYLKREVARRPYPSFHKAAGPERAASAVVARPRTGQALRGEVDRILLSRYSPAGVVVDERLEVLEIRGRATPYLSLPAGTVSFSLLSLVPDTGFYLEIEKLIHQARASGEAARRERVPFELDGGCMEVDIEALPLQGERPRAHLILFEPSPSAAQPGGAAEGASQTPAGEKDRYIAKLKSEIAVARQRLLSIVEEHRASSEEAQSVTEEALSANEELQSLNEELETAKEELQSSNEELVTLNQEIQAKNTALVQARDLAMSIVETVREPLLVLDTELRIKKANPAFYSGFRTSRLETEDRSLYSICEGGWDIPDLRDVLDRVLPEEKAFRDLEMERDFPRLGHRILVLSGSRLDHLDLIFLAIEDITARRDAEKALLKREEHLRQAQKMEAIGRLAGGIAHDFNNLLTAVIGYSDLVLDSLSQEDENFQALSEIKHAGQRAASLTDQLLAFSRRKILQPKTLELGAVVKDFERMLRRLLDERIRVIIESQDDLWRVRADPGEITRVLMNLCLNARDAMPDGGNLTIQTANVTLGEPDARAHDLRAGPWVMLSVRDTGTGMDPEMRAHVFEPFFTTKETGKGTGLGLATALGIVEQSGGAIWCNSEPGQGTTFNILLPAVEESADRIETPADSLAKAPGGSAEVVLLVEDEEMVRQLACRILRQKGYEVLEARDGREGLALCQSHSGPIQLLLSDVVMPELGGRELAERAAMLRPDMKVLFMSGHTQDLILREGIKEGTPFLQKPFSPSNLARKVREVLDSQGNNRASAGA